MKILYLANVRMPTERAYGLQIIHMCKAFAAAGASVLLLYPYRRSQISSQNVFSYYSIPRSFEAKRFFAPDFYLPGPLNVLAFHIKNFLSALYLMFYAINHRASVVYSRDELVIFLLSFLRKDLYLEAHRFSGARKMFYKRFRSKGIRIVTITQAIKNEFLKAGFSGSSILVAPDGADIEAFDIDVSREEARTHASLPKEKDIVLYAGHLFEQKGAYVLAETARILPDISFVFVGGTEHEIKEFKIKYSDAKNITVIGHRPYQEIPMYLKAADILILPNSGKAGLVDQYTSPLKMFEYMASRRPIIASDIPVLKEVLNPGNAFLISPDDPQILADSILNLLANKELQNTLADRAFADVSAYDWKIRARDIIRFMSS